MKISVVMATYNGEEYIDKQLQSILNQSRRPDEVVICDDISKDNTTALIKAFIEKNNLEESWRLYINEVNKGYKLNFAEALGYATGDVIFYSDQDDIWIEDKIEKMSRCFDNKKILALSADHNCIDQDDNQINGSIRKFVFKKSEGTSLVTFVEQIKYNRSAGLELAFKKELIPEIIALVRKYHVTHDLPVGMLAAMRKGYYVSPEKVVNYRLHINNTSAPRLTFLSRIRNVKAQIESEKAHLLHKEAFWNEYKSELTQQDSNMLKDCIELTGRAVESLEKRNISEALVLLFKKNKMINKWISVNNLLCTIFGDYSNI